MRTFEIILILVNILSLVLSFGKQSKATWWSFAVVNLIVFVIHAIIEGLRYQMIFSYLFVVLLSGFTIVKTSNRFFERKTPNALKIIAVSVCFALLSFTSVLSYALPVFTLPEPTGTYAVGIQYLRLIDESRSDPFLDGSTEKRELMVKAYYPASPDDTKPLSKYFGNSSELIRAFAAFYNLPDFAFDHLNLVRTNSKENLQLSNEQQSYPVILFSHGAGATMEVQTSQSEDLASHGFIVVTIDHTYASAATAFHERVVSHKEATTDFNIPEPAEIITQIMADDSKFVIDMLEKMNHGDIESIFRGRLDLEQIGAIGHSVGGAVAYHLAINDSRVKAAINLDGVVYITPGDPNDVAPFLMLASETFYTQAIWNSRPLMKTFEEMDEVEQKIAIEIHGSKEAYGEAYNKAGQNMIGLLEVLTPSENLFIVQGSDHMKFTDMGLFIGLRQLRELIGIRGETDPARCLEVTKAVTLAFFDQHLKGESSPPLESLLIQYPELRRANLK